LVTPTSQLEAWAHFGPVDIASNYWGTHLYVTNAGSHDLSAYTIDRPNGNLTKISGSPYALVGSGGHVGVHPSGRFVYATTTTFKGGNYGIHAFAVQSDDSLVPVSGSPFGGSELSNPSAVVVTKNYLYVSAHGNGFGGIGAFSIDQTSGALTPIPGSPFPTPDAEVPDSLSTNAKGSYLYANLNGADAIAGYAIDPSTGVLNDLPASPYIEGTHNPNLPKGPYVVQVDPNGKFVFASDLFRPEFSVFKRDLNTGVLTYVNSYRWPGVCFPDNMSIDPSGTFLYTMASAGTVCGGPSTMLGFSLDQANGSLNSVLGPLFFNSNLFTGTIGEKVLVTR
jgi:6-phosphogluconolactonase (cycloisomerase 2 family)